MIRSLGLSEKFISFISFISFIIVFLFVFVVFVCFWFFPKPKSRFGKRFSDENLENYEKILIFCHPTIKEVKKQW